MSFEQSAVQVLGTLQHAVADLLAHAPTEIRKAVDVERVFGVNRLLGWQVYRIASAKNPLAAGVQVPARVSMKKLMTAAARRRVPATIIERVSDAFEAFERFVETDAGDRKELEAMLSGFLPEERYKQELASREAAFRAISQVRGVANDADIATTFFKLSADGSGVDRASINAVMGMRRSRVDASLMFSVGDFSPSNRSVFTLDGQPCEEALATLLREFSTSPLPGLELHRIDSLMYYYIRGQDIGLRSAANIVIADLRPKMLPRYWAPGLPRYRGPGYFLTFPVKRLTMDVFVHRDVYPGVIPELRVYDAVPRGEVAVFGDPVREVDRLVTHDMIRPLPTGVQGAKLTNVPRYVDMLDYAYSALKWNPAEFRGYRLDVEYPIYGAQYRMGFKLPETR